MPSTTEARRRRWPGSDSQAMTYLYARGFMLTRSWCWFHPKEDFECNCNDIDAIVYLIEEWDFGPKINNLDAKDFPLRKA